MAAHLQAAVPIALVGWRVWDLYAANEVHKDTLTRGVLVNIDRNGVVAPENDRQITASELDMILECFHDYAMAFHITTPADENRVPGFLDKLATRYPGIKGRTFHIATALRPDTCDALRAVKHKHDYRIVLPYYTLHGADAWAPSVAVSDQIVYDASVARGQQLNLDERTVNALRLIAEVSRAPIGLAGRLNAQLVGEMTLPIAEVRAQVQRPLALAGDIPLKTDHGLDVARATQFHDACVKALGL